MTPKIEIIEKNTIYRSLIVPAGMSGHNSLFVGQIGDWTWEAVHQLCSINPYLAKNNSGNPSYLSFFYYHILGNPTTQLKSFSIGDEIEVITSLYQCNEESLHTIHQISLAKNAKNSRRKPITVETLYDNPDKDCLYVENFNRWISRTNSNSNEKLIKAAPKGFKYKHLPKISEKYPPWNFYQEAIETQSFFKEFEQYENLNGEDFVMEYQVDSTQDINGVGLLYFASYFTIFDKALLSLWKSLGGTEDNFLKRKVLNQKICYLGNADYSNTLLLSVKLYQKQSNPNSYVFNITASRQNNQKIIAISTIETLIPQLLEKKSFPQYQIATTFPSQEGSRLEDITRRIIKVFAATLKRNKNKIEVNTDFQEFGLNSVTIVAFIENLSKEFQIKEEYQIEFNPSTFFRFRNIQNLALFLNEKLSPGIKYPLHKSEKNLSKKETTQAVYSNKDIAVIGMACRFPGANNCEEFWQNLVEGRDSIREIPKTRWDWQHYFGDPQKEKNKTNSKWGGFIENVDTFDAKFFKISPREAELMDPQQRIFLETVWKGIEDSGYNPVSFAGKEVGLFVGVSNTDYLELLKEEEIEAYTATGSAHSILANRISYLLDLRGPSQAIDTACSSSLVALYQAVCSLQQGKSKLAIAGGVNLLLTPSLFVSYGKAGMLSSDGRCKTFDQSANGYVRGEGVGVVLLKPLKQAISDKDNIRAVIKGAAFNHGGKTQSLTAPNPDTQAKLIQNAYHDAQLFPQETSYIEAHGTGTKLGDPVEFSGLKQVFESFSSGKEASKNYCGLGSVKTNIGHLESAAGIAGLIKVILSMQHRKLPKNLHFNEINSHINIEESPFYIVKETQKWLRQKETNNGVEKPLRAGVSSFGSGGANAHLILEEYIPDETKKTQKLKEISPQLVLLSAQNETQLKEYAQLFLQHLKQVDVSLADMAYTLQVGRKVMDVKLAILTKSQTQLQKQLSSYLKAEETENLYFHKSKFSNIGISLLLEENNVKETLLEWFRQKKWDHLAKLWLQNTHIDWEFLYSQEKHSQSSHYRVSLPTSFFAKEKYWVGNSNPLRKMGLVQSRNGHPLIGKNISTLSKRFAEKRPLSNRNKRKISLPPSSFAKKKCWLNLGKKNFSEKKPSLFVPHKNNASFKTKKESINLILAQLISTPALKSTIELIVKLEWITKEIVLVRMEERENKNMFSSELIMGLQYRFYQLQQVPTLKVVILTGYDNIFCMGGTKEELLSIFNKEAQFTDLQFLYKGLLEFKLPVISAMQGHAYGGGLIFGLYADIVVMAEEGIYASNFTKYGFTPGMGATYLLKEKFGNNLATEMMFTAKSFTGEELKTRGASVLFRKKTKVLEEAFSIAQQLTEKPRKTLQVLKQGLAEKILESLEHTIEKELEMHEETFSEKEVQNRIQAHFNKATSNTSIESPQETESEPLNTKIETSFKSKISAQNSLEKEIFVVEPQKSLAEIEENLRQIILEKLHFEEDEMDLDQSFNAMGIDSIYGIEVIKEINKKFALNLDATTLYDHPTIHKLAQFLLPKIAPSTSSQKLDQQKIVSPFSQTTINSTSNQVPQKIVLRKPVQLKTFSSLSQKNSLEKVQLKTVKNTLIEKRQKLTSNTSLKNSLLNENKLASLHLNLEQIELGTRNTKKEQKEIAIIGMSGRFPDAENVEVFWNNLENGKNSITEIPQTRWDIEAFYSPVPEAPNKSYSKWGGFIEGIEYFDPLFFNISPSEAELMDPQQRLFLEEAYKALEEAGYSSHFLEGKNCGVFVGGGQGDYHLLLKEEKVAANAQAMMGNSSAILAARISYCLNLKGPALFIDTACSSSLVAVHLAFQSILNGECEMALAGGVCLFTTPEMHISTSKMGMLSKSGKCNTFSNKADGIVIGESVGVVVLKSLEQAKEDGDQIYGVIKGSGINQDGATNGITAPSADSQTNLELSVYQKYQINPENISYVEAHGTGTKLGDPIEIKALNNAFKKFTNKKQFCGIGSVKTNIGHTLTAAGIAGLIKLLLCFKYQKLPPSLNCEEKENEHIQFKETPFYVNKTLKEWKIDKNKPKLAALSSFGFSGTNAHLILEEYQPSTKNTKKKNANKAFPLFVLSAKSKEQLENYVANYLEYVGENLEELDINSLLYTVQTGREAFNYRLAVECESTYGLYSKLKKFVANKSNKATTIGKVEKREWDKKKLALIEKASLKNKEVKTLAHLWVLGAPLNFSNFYTQNSFQKLTLPTYPFQKNRYWIEELTRSNKMLESALVRKHPLLNKTFSDFKINVAKISLQPELKSCQKIALPTYPFEKEQFWFEETIQRTKELENTSSQLHSLIHQNISTLEEQCFKTIFSGKEFYLRDHIIQERMILPGVCYVEMAKAAAELSSKQRVSKIKQIVWLAPIIVEHGQEKEIYTSIFYDEKGETRYEIYSLKENSEKLIHGQGFIEFAEKAQEENTETVKIELKNYEEVTSKKELYAHFHHIGLTIKDTFWTVDKIYSNEETGYAVVALKNKRQHELQDFYLHPSLLDGILQSAFSVSDKEQYGDSFKAPYSIKEIELFSKLEETNYVSITKCESNNTAIEKFNFVVFDKFGKVKLKIHEFFTRRLDGKAEPEKVKLKVERKIPAQKSELHELVNKYLLETASKILKLEKSRLSPAENLSKFGFESLSINTLTTEINKKFSLQLTPALFFEHTTLASFSEFLIEEHLSEVENTLSFQRSSSILKLKRVESKAEKAAIPEIVFKNRFLNRTKKVSLEENLTAENIAIIGMAGQFPGATNLAEYWNHLELGTDLITEIPKMRWDWKKYFGDPQKEENKTFSKWGGFIENIDTFDPLFFNISPLEAELMDPQQRLLLESTWKTIEDAGYNSLSLMNSKTGVFIGVSTSDYSQLIYQNRNSEAYANPGNAHSVVANRISYYFGFRGPSEPIDTACSSSLVALNRAVKSINAGECTQAIVGGVNAILTPPVHLSFSKAGMLAPDGRCKTFSKEANGYVRGEGVATILLKPLDAAKRDKDQIYAIIKGTSVNHGGHVSSLTVPNPNAQAELIGVAQLEANIPPETITYMECHGTGTSLGDPIEINGLKKAFQKVERKNYCTIGSAKSNIGHLEAAAGIAGIIKAVLSMKHKAIPKTLHVSKETVNPYIELENTPFKIAFETSPWKKLEKNIPRRAGVSSFGFGGANAHVVLEEYETPRQELEKQYTKKAIPLFLLSAKSKEQLENYVATYLDYVGENLEELDINSLLYTVQTGREPFDYRLAIECESTYGLYSKLKKLNSNKPDKATITGKVEKREWDKKKLALVEKICLKNQKLKTLAQFWIQGAPLNFSNLYTQNRIQKISLPTYPFQKNRYWVEDLASSNKILESQLVGKHPLLNTIFSHLKLNVAKTSFHPNVFQKLTLPTYPFQKNRYWIEESEQKAKELAKLHSLIHENTSTMEGQRFSSKFSGEEFFFRDHLVLGKKTLPGVAYLEMARVAAELSGLKATLIKNVVWLVPIQVEEKKIKIHLALYPESETETAFEFYDDNEISGDQSNNEKSKIIYCQGLLSSEEFKQTESKLDVKKLEQQFKETDISTLYKNFKELGLDYQNSFQSIKKLYKGDNEFLGEALALVSIPVSENEKEAKYRLHPSLMDGILQTSIAAIETNQLSLPFSLKSFEVYGELPHSVYAHAKKRLKGGLELKIYSLSGQFLGKLNEFIVAPIGKLEEKNEKQEKNAIPVDKSESEIILKIEEKLIEITSSVLKLNKKKLLPNKKLSKYGLDSISFISLTNSINQNLGLTLTPALFFEHQTLHSFARFLLLEYPEKMEKLLDGKKSFKIVSTFNKNNIVSNKALFKRNSLRIKSRISNDDVAIVGMSGAFGGAANLDEFWQNLIDEKDCVSEIPKTRWDWQNFYGDPIKEADKTSIKEASFLKDIDKFDAKFFNISPIEAELMDPQQRILIEHVWKAIEDSGNSAESLSGSNTALFIGCMNDDYKEILSKNNRLEPQVSTGLHLSILTNRISYLFNFHGASEPVNTACSSSLVALHRGIQVLREEKSKVAIAGGVNAILSPTPFIVAQHAGMLSEDGRCKTYSNSANGYGRGEGVGVVVLKLLKKAILDGDRIHAVLRGSATNHGGHVSGITVPNPVAQEMLLKESYDNAKIDFSTITYFENHGTGTELGDPVEINGLKKAFGKQESNYYCTIGTVKSNIGHTEGAAGIAGVLKTVLAMKHKIIPKTLHVSKETVNPYIELENSPFKIAFETNSWKRLDKETPRRAGVSSFGFGGANAHVILEEYVAPPQDLKSKIIPLFVLSAKSKESLDKYVKSHLQYFEDKPEQFGSNNYFYTVQTGRTIFEHRLAIYSEDKITLLARLQKYLKGRNDSNTFYQNQKVDIPNQETKVKIELLVKLFLKIKNYQKISKIWANTGFDFKFLYQNSLQNGLQKISLPTYPFSKEKYWIEISDCAKNQIPKQPKFHPLLDENFSIFEKSSKKELLYPIENRRKISLPTYPFTKRRTWFNSNKKKAFQEKASQSKFISQKRKDLVLKESQESLFVEKEFEEGLKKELESKVTLELIGKEIALIRMNDPEQRNMLSEKMLLGLQHRFSQLSQMSELKVVILTGYDNVFCMGGVKEELVRISEQRMDFKELQFLYRGIVEFDLPVITAIQGHAYGGGLLFGLYGDIVLMAEESVYSANFIKYGFTPGLGSTFLLEKKLGAGIANEMMFTAKSFTGKQLKERGASVLFRSQESVLEEAFILAKNLSEKTRSSLKILKQGLSESILEHLHETVAKEAQMIQQSSLDPNMRARVDSFFDKTASNLKTNKTTSLVEKKKAIVVEKEALVAEKEEVFVEIEPHLIEEKLKTIFIRILNFEDEEIDPEMTFDKMGVDSIIGVEILRDINNEFNLNLEAIILYDYPTFQSLTPFLAQEISSLKKIKSVSQEANISNLKTNKTTSLVEKKKAIVVEKEALVAEKEEVFVEIEPHLIEEKLKTIFIRILNFEDEEIDPEMTFDKMGVDSIIGVEILRDINNEFNLNLEAIILYDYPTFQSLTPFLAQEISSLKKIKSVSQGNSLSSSLINATKNKVENVAEEKALLSKINLKPLNLSVSKKELAPYFKRVSGKKDKKLSLKPLKSKLVVKRKTESQFHLIPKINTKKATKKEGMNIAIVGISGRFSEAQNVDEFWNNLKEGKSSIKEIPNERWDVAQYFDSDPKAENKSVSKYGGFLEDIHGFDPLFFKISPSEAFMMDPGQRLFLEECWNALEDAGSPPQSLINKKCGVFVGVGPNSHLLALKEKGIGITSQTFTGISNAILAARISYFFNLKGPSLTIDTACSSSLVAIHLACQSILNGESEMALAGGVCLITSPEIYIMTSKINMLSSSEKCKAFDNQADGITLGEGLGAIVLKPLEKALEDKDQIYGVIQGSGMNQDGETNGITAPSSNSQSNLELDVYRKHKINPENISYVEAQGTGTKLGDTIEVKALNNAFKDFTDKKQFCGIGSLKPNIGHTMAASGIASVLKVLLCLKHKKIPLSLNCEEENKNIDFKETPFYVNKTLKFWEANGKPRMAAINSFGFSGTNAHLVIEEYLDDVCLVKEEKPFSLITLSAKTDWSLKQRMENFLSWLEAEENTASLEKISFNLNVRKTHFKKRVVFVVASKEELCQLLKDSLKHYGSSKILSNEGVKKSFKENATLKELLKKIETELSSSSLSAKEYREKLDTLGDFYLKGYEINWKTLYPNSDYKMLSLPTYPFEKQSYLLEEPSKKSNEIPFGKNDFKEKESEPLEKTLQEKVECTLQEQISKLLKVDIKHVEIDKVLSEFGFDSISLTEFIIQLNAMFQFELIPTLFFEYNTIEKFSNYLVEEHEELLLSYYEAPLKEGNSFVPQENKATQKDFKIEKDSLLGLQNDERIESFATTKIKVKKKRGFLKWIIGLLLIIPIKIFFHLFYRLELNWINNQEKEDFEEVKMFVYINHTSLYDLIFLARMPWKFIWNVYPKMLIPGADTTLKRPFVGTLSKLLGPVLVPISRKWDKSWQDFTNQITEDSILFIFPEGRMMRANGLDKDGKPMSIQGGVVDLLQLIKTGKMMLVYSEGLHHIQIPGQLSPKVFQKIVLNVETLEIEDYLASFPTKDSLQIKGLILQDLEERKQKYCSS